MDIQYIGENLLPGKIGHFFTILTFVGSLFSAFCYFKAATTETKDPTGSNIWLRMARNSFVIHSFALFGIFFALYYIITNHLFEYNYAWAHSSRALPGKYLLSCFWEGQEGSFMLWTFWHCILGFVVMAKAKALESRTMTVISIVQVALSTMLLGFQLSPTFKIGSTPFVLLRDVMAGAPIFSDPEYLGKYIVDGNGLNVLLQNYWMVIHPPILFLGFASTLIPFAFAIAALWKGDYKEWIKPGVAWSLFSGGVLGLGIMMGGAWAYESLTFGGYWAWDPVENASLVPWLTLVAGLHTLVVYRATGRNFIITMVFYILTYLLVWYSTFLTRTGILGDTSVHAFTGEGSALKWHLIVVLAFLFVMSMVMLFRKWKSLPRVLNEEAASSREFWMFIGSFVLLLSAAHIIGVTSIPVWGPWVKGLLGKDIAPPADREGHYNSVQVWIAFVLLLLSALVLFTKFKKTGANPFWKRIIIITGISGLLTFIIGYTQKIDTWQYDVLLFSACFGLVANIYYAFGVQRGSLNKRGAALTHFGFAMMIVGILLSSYNKEVISLNTTGRAIDLGRNDPKKLLQDSRENIVMYRGVKVAMGEYYSTYLGDSTSPDDPRFFYKVLFEKQKGKPEESFTLYPDAFINPKGQGQGLSANPSSKHYFNKDVFSYVSSVLDKSKLKDTTKYTADTLRMGDTAFFSNGYLVFNGFNKAATIPAEIAANPDAAVGAMIDVYTMNGAKPYKIEPKFYVQGNSIITVDDTVKDLALYTRLVNIIPQMDAAVIALKQQSPNEDYIVLKVLLFPWINVLWAGVVIMVAGFMLSMFNRSSKKAAAGLVPED